MSENFRAAHVRTLISRAWMGVTVIGRFCFPRRLAFTSQNYSQACALVLLVLIGGCTTSLSVRKVDLAKPETRVGIPYSLMFSRYEIVISRQVVKCGKELLIATTAEIKSPVAAPDPKNLFVIDPNSLSSPLKTSDVVVGFSATGSPTSLNANAVDRSAQIIANIAATAVSIAGLAAGVPVMPPGAPAAPAAAAPDPETVSAPAKSTDACSDVVLAALAQAKRDATALEASTKVVETRTEQLRPLQQKAVALTPNVDERTKSALGNAYSDLVAAVADQTTRKEALEESLREIMYTQTVHWPNHGNEPRGSFRLPEFVLMRWMRFAPTRDDHARTKVGLLLQSVGAEGRNLESPDNVAPILGVPFRQPVLGRLSVCAITCGSEQNVIATLVGDVLQLGYVYYLPCESRPFSSISCTYTISDSGRLQTMGSAAKTATLEGLTGAFKDIVDKATQIRDIRSTAETKKLELETARLKAQADRDAAKAALQSDPLKADTEAAAALNAKTAVLNAERARIEAEIALAEARASMP